MINDYLNHTCDITVLVTCYNEAEFIAATIEAVLDALNNAGVSYDVIVMDDCSSDNSFEVIQKYLAERADPQVRILRNDQNQGLAANFVMGAHLGRGKYYRLCCGDNPDTTEALTDIFRHAGKADLVLPYQPQDEVTGKPAHRKIISKTFTWLVNLLSGNKIRYYNALPVYRRFHVLRFPPVSYGFGFQADIVTRLLDEDITFMQIRHLGSTDRKPDSSTALSMRNLLSVIHTFIEILIRRVRRIIYGKNLRRAQEISAGD
ncbi:MAG: glycosyltransferase family 2 protein [Proteobacteria bacterium]|nr:glycosyltransferase family 2 protein [Pseudomonadota bacterium]MBU1595261.1 glycosyltransferase family 2 protein [Pseudomonadota bacterium]